MLGFFMKGLTMNNTQIYNSINLLIHIFNNKKKLKVLYYITLNENNIINWITKNNFVLRIDQNNNLISNYN